MSSAVKRSNKKRSKVTHDKAVVHVLATQNNTKVTFTVNGNTICWSSAGACGYKGKKQSTPFAATEAARDAAAKARNDYGVSRVDVILKGIGPGREAAIRGIITELGQNSLCMISDITGIPHNGARGKGERRV